MATPHDQLEDIDGNDEQQEMDQETVTQLIEKVRSSFKQLFGETVDIKPNTFNIKLELIDTARKKWAELFSHTFDITVVINNGDIMDGVVKICVHSNGIRLLGDDDLPVNEIGFVEVMQMAEEM